jgi:hypothetical protein
MSISSKLHRNVPLVVNFQKCSKNLIPSRTLVVIATERKKLKISSFRKPQELELIYLA